MTYDRIEMNRLNNGTPMIREIPFGIGNLVQRNSERATGLLGDIRKARKFNCGVFVPDDVKEKIGVLNESGVVGLGATYCKTVSAAILNGDANELTSWNAFPSSQKAQAYEALNNGTIDALANALIEFKYDIGTEDLKGVQLVHLTGSVTNRWSKI